MIDLPSKATEHKGDGIMATLVRIDGQETTYVAEHVGGTRWNGWLRPFFTLAESREMAGEVLRWDDESQRERPSVLVMGGEVFTWEDETPEDPQRPGWVRVPVVEAHDGTRLFGIGAGSWVWEEARCLECDGALPAYETDRDYLVCPACRAENGA